GTLGPDGGGLPLYIMENGAAFVDEIGPDGAVHDPQRLAYFDAHLRACHRAITAGVPLHGYFAWSLLDHFDCASAYRTPFRLVYGDCPAQRRVVKARGAGSSGVMARGGLGSGEAGG